MTGPVNARSTLIKARLFLEMTERLKTNERDEFFALLEASIVFGRSVTNHIQKQFRRREGFKEWYCEHQRQMRNDPLMKFLYDTRTFILKKGPLQVTRVISVSALDAVALGVPSVVAKPIRASPWYRRSPLITYRDIRAEVTRHIRKWQQGIALREEHITISPRSTRISQQWQFDHPDWKDQSARQLIRQYFVKLEQVVDEAERRFGGDSKL